MINKFIAVGIQFQNVFSQIFKYVNYVLVFEVQEELKVWMNWSWCFHLAELSYCIPQIKLPSVSKNFAK